LRLILFSKKLQITPNDKKKKFPYNPKKKTELKEQKLNINFTMRTLLGRVT